jgi:hypothetical protein
LESVERQEPFRLASRSPFLSYALDVGSLRVLIVYCRSLFLLFTLCFIFFFRDGVTIDSANKENTDPDILAFQDLMNSFAGGDEDFIKDLIGDVVISRVYIDPDTVPPFVEALNTGFFKKVQDEVNTHGRRVNTGFRNMYLEAVSDNDSPAYFPRSETP